MRKKQAQHLDARYVTMVENAYYYCNPPPVEKTVKKKRPPLQEYIRKLLYKDLSKVTTEKVLRQMRKLPWQDPEVKSYLICCMVNIWNVKYNSIHCVANLLAGLVAYQEDVGIHVVDGVLEDIRLGMEVNRCRNAYVTADRREERTDSSLLTRLTADCHVKMSRIRENAVRLHPELEVFCVTSDCFTL